jgi:hypothetical protein
MVVNPCLQGKTPVIEETKSIREAGARFMGRFIKQNMPAQLRVPGRDMTLKISVIELDEKRGNKLFEYGEEDLTHLNVTFRLMKDKPGVTKIIDIDTYKIPQDVPKLKVTPKIGDFVNKKNLTGGDEANKSADKSAQKNRRIPSSIFDTDLWTLDSYDVWYRANNAYIYFPHMYRDLELLEYLYYYPAVNWYVPYTAGLGFYLE